MMTYKLKQSLTLLLLLSLSFKWCCDKGEDLPYTLENTAVSNANNHQEMPIAIKVTHTVTVDNYFQYIDSIVSLYDSLTPYKLTEHMLVRFNPWIMDTLQHTDYYHMMARDSFVYDQKKMIVLPKDAKIIIPDALSAKKLFESFDRTLIDINIPEFKLRILEDSVSLYEFPIRVGKDEKKYLEMAGRTLDLKTKTGKGSIVAHVKNPDYYNPVNGHRYYTTRRDDQKITLLPQIPFLVTEINGLKNGQLIHPTTNPVSLGKAYSNGCIGVKEADAWVIYYYAPIGTKMHIRYDLLLKTVHGKDSTLKDVYKYYKNTKGNHNKL